MDLRNILDLVVLSATIVETFCDQIIWTAQNRFSIRTIARNTLILTMSTNPNPYVLGMRPSSKWEASHIFISKPFSGLWNWLSKILFEILLVPLPYLCFIEHSVLKFAWLLIAFLLQPVHFTSSLSIFVHVHFKHSCLFDILGFSLLFLFLFS